MTGADASRIQSTQVRLFHVLTIVFDVAHVSSQAKGGADVGKGTFPARAQAGAAKNAAGGAPSAKGAKGKAA